MLKRRNRKRQQQEPLIDWDAIRRFALAGGTLLAITASVIFVFLLLDRPVASIQVDGPFARVNASQIEAEVLANMQGGFISLDLDSLSARIRRLPWVDRVRIRRQWPNGLHITLVEQRPAARWGESGLLNVRGELFIDDSRHVPAGLPYLAGPPGTEIEVVNRFLAARSYLLPHGLDVVGLVRDPRGAWDMTLSNGVAIRLGRHRVDERITRYGDLVLEIVGADPGKVEYVDMRYSNGFAIGWRKQDEAAAAARLTAHSG
ncbi:MAG: cell division protein FtsQ/DivIB [Gammaproteobacteria bacterium]|nr:cell division protein FtsQ/DivIB [Gammaproteobacteria bacterium]MCZ6715948.1 cell division protein FtsQ/DivIB [Gammaproteobacteria bacterium]MCZ6826103.1 cell division protein FtsQ/DivIB [Gammaproteobacteria bacterium]MCZ6911939.1 cell division protein FtsQ/DivIB [Pseudomonadota bacterium]